MFEMFYRFIAHLMAFTIALTAVAQTAAACPKCRVATADLDEQSILASPDAATQPGDATARTGAFRGFSFAIGVDVPTAYYYRGYLQQDRGLILQPFMTASMNFQPRDGLSIQPYVGWTNTFFGNDNADLSAAHSGGIGRGVRSRVTEVPGVPPSNEPTFVIDLVPTGGDGRGWYESDIMVGTSIYFKDLFIDVNYHVHLFPDDVHDTMQEIGGKISYDLARLWDRDTPALNRTFSLRPAFTIYTELSDDNGGEETFMELALEPAWRFEAFGRRAAITTPIAVSGSPDGYYVDTSFNDEDLGYFSASVKGSISLPAPDNLGKWFLNGSVTYIRMLNEGLEQSNRGDRDDFYASIGIGVSF